MNEDQRQQISECYCQYCSIIKPLIAQIEALSEKFPEQLFNEIRAFNDHIARCYYRDPAEKYIDSQIDKAQRHIARITLDCFKCLNVILYQKIEVFEKQTRNIDLTVIDNGLFYPKYSQLKVNAVNLVFKAKTTEGFDLDESLNFYQKAYNVYSEIIDNINSVSEKVKWARVRFSFKRYGNLAGYVISIVISALVSAYFSCELLHGCSSHNAQTAVDSISVTTDTIRDYSGKPE